MAASKRKMPKSGRNDTFRSLPVKRSKISEGKATKPSPGSTKEVSNATPSKLLDVHVCGYGDRDELDPRQSVRVTQAHLNKILDTETDGVVDIASGGMHVAALTRGNRILTWGFNASCARGRNPARKQGHKAKGAGDSYADNPCGYESAAITGYQFPPETKIVSLSAADNATWALTEDGLVYGWGSYVMWDGKPGFYFNSMNEHVAGDSNPILIPGLKNIIQICAGANFCLALDNNGKVYSWGRGDQSQLGRRLVVSRADSTRHSTMSIETLRTNMCFVPGIVPLPKAKKIVSIHAGSDHAFAIDSEGNTWAWGLNNFGQTGITAGVGIEGQGGTVAFPKKVPSLTGKNMKMLVGGSCHSVGITHSGECLVWGRLDGRWCGFHGSPTDDPKKVFHDGKKCILLEPTPLFHSGCTDASAGAYHNLLVRDNSKVYSWGLNSSRQCSQSPNEYIRVPTLIGSESIRGKKISRIGVGAQHSIIALAREDVEIDEAPAKTLRIKVESSD
ncbi:hypothetical protein ACJ72_00676 [Emergomyces africanus]|uniref:RCC1-like domain-containing protein n=1 Tax=Emergomyces africanus TaxID=1955775 RepID=A0A1B7P7E2_9EURO|nr:hypothetical protein ACJ72_00676 [Emergomyces africanus]